MNPKNPPPFEIPDLEISASSVRVPGRRANGTSHEPTSTTPSTRLDEEPEEAGAAERLPELELAEDPNDVRNARLAHRDGSLAARPAPCLDPGNAVELTCHHPMPTPPSSWVAAPIYAWLVFRQKARPKHEEERLAARLSASQHEHDTAVVDLAQSLHAALLDDARYASPIAEFGRAEQAYRHLVGHTEKTEESGPVDSESAGSLPRLQAELDAGRNEREDAELGLRRVRARYQRLQIELRAAQSQGETGVDRVATIRNEMSQVLEFVAGAETRLEQAEKAHAAAQRALGATRLALRRAEDRLRAQQQRGTERHSETSQPRDAARRRVVETGYDLCRAVLLAHNRPAPDPTLVERFGRAEEELRVVLAEQSILKESARAVDEGLVRTGWVMTLGSAALICWLVWLAFR